MKLSLMNSTKQGNDFRVGLYYFINRALIINIEAELEYTVTFCCHLYMNRLEKTVGTQTNSVPPSKRSICKYKTY